MAAFKETDTFEQLVKAFLAMIPGEGDSAEEEMPQEVITGYYAARFPVLRQLDMEHVVNAVRELRERVIGEVKALAADFNREDFSRRFRCTNHDCEFKVVTEDAISIKWPDADVVAMVKPGGTVPFGLCPECGHPIYTSDEIQRERAIHPSWGPIYGYKVTPVESSADNTGAPSPEDNADSTAPLVKWAQDTTGYMRR
jgi:hypothetical protein